MKAAPPPPSLRASTGGADSLAEAHARFARAALLIYLGAAAVAVALLITALLTDKSHDEDLIRERLLLETDVRAHSLGQHLGLLVEEIRRLSLRSEINLLDQDLSPEKSLLQLSHEKSTFFNLGVGIISPKGTVLWSEPRDFLNAGASFALEPWFTAAQDSQLLQIVPVHPDKPDAVVYVLAPLIKNREFVGALLGGVDLARGEPLARDAVPPTANALTVLATQDGTVIYPPKPPEFSTEVPWRRLFERSAALEPFTQTILLSDASTVVASSPVPGTSLVLLSVAKQDDLLRDARTRLATRLALGLVLATSPLLILVVLLQRSLALFKRSEASAVREERLRLLGEAANSIAHEVKNALNGLSMGLDLVVRRDDKPEAAARRERIVGELRSEMRRLTDFTTELMTFSKGIEPRRTKLDLTEFLPKVTGLIRDAAVERGAEIDLAVPENDVIVDADPTLLHAVISNLAGNALDAVTGKGAPTAPRVEVELAVSGRVAELRVRDNGPGVSASMRSRLFEPFQTEKPNGVGIGLALSKKIAVAHGGDLVLEDSALPNKDAGPARPSGAPRATGSPLPEKPQGRLAPSSLWGNATLDGPPPPPRGATFLLTLPLEEA